MRSRNSAYRILKALVAGLLTIGALGAGAATPVFGPADLMATLAQVKAAHETFTERLYVRMLERPVESSGTLVYTAPGHLEKNTLLPRVETLVLDGDQVVIDTPDKHEHRVLALKDYPIVWAFVESIRSTLAGDLSTLDRFYGITLTGSSGAWVLTLVPKEPSMRRVLAQVQISGRASDLQTIEIRQPNGDRSVMTLIASPS